ncbi:N-alpha-acetyltransferase 50 [Trichuris trichiura]|uniref:N-terminal methionine N(alpha)-acetyltransferase NatE n=1 Tax=Trichuris trichiura TaxID=36087 RepID=A0A077ZG25_TRITR|nr:N-alpha-acetyltransferase 50 [Trichuris trichiura]
MFRARVALGDITVHNIKQLKRINQIVFPVTYSDRFYSDVTDLGPLAKFVYFNDLVVGAVCCRVIMEDIGKKLYIMTLGCLPSYRCLGLGTMMLEYIFECCRSDESILSIYLHVQVNNFGALEFYKKFGFEVVAIAQNYYKRIEPSDALVLEKWLVQPSSHETSNENGVAQ